MVASGLLVSEGDRVAEAFAGLGFAETDRLIHAGWTALVLAKVRGT